MEIAEFAHYRVLATGGGEKLEDWNGIVLLRPDPQAIWDPPFDLAAYPGLHARYERSADGGGRWQVRKKHPAEWTIPWAYEDIRLKFLLKPMGFKHTGLFPEQSVNWQKIIRLIRGAGRPVSVLNLFAYTGGATAAALAAGATVCQVDASKGMTERAGQNVDLSGLSRERLRLIVDDCLKFVAREQRRGHRYDAVIMDPPSYGRGPGGEMWKLESGLYDLVRECEKLLSETPLFFLINSYTTGLQPAVLRSILNLALAARPGGATAYEVVLPTQQVGVVLPCGASGLWVAEGRAAQGIQVKKGDGERRGQGKNRT